MRLVEVQAGEKFSKNGEDFIVLRQETGQTVVVTKDIDMVTVFDTESPQWSASSLRNYLNTSFIKSVEEIFGAENLIYNEADMTSLDGFTYYGKCMDKIRLMSFEEIKQFPNLENTSGEWEMTTTPWSIPERGGEYSLCLAAYRGFVRNYDCRNAGAIRPLMVVKNDVEVDV